MTLNKSETMCQPCDNFTDDPSHGNPHGCNSCDGLRYFCTNCFRDHHSGGWQTCPGNGSRALCLHPACIAAEAAACEECSIGPTIYCHGCSAAGGASMPVYHLPPECESK